MVMIIMVLIFMIIFIVSYENTHRVALGLQLALLSLVVTGLLAA